MILYPADSDLLDSLNAALRLGDSLLPIEESVILYTTSEGVTVELFITYTGVTDSGNLFALGHDTQNDGMTYSFIFRKNLSYLFIAIPTKCPTFENWPRL